MLIFGFLSIFFIGYLGISAVFFKKDKEFKIPLGEILPLSFGFGVGFLSFEMFIFSCLNIKFSIIGLILPWFLLFLFLVLQKKLYVPEMEKAVRFSVIGKVSLAITSLIFLYSIISSVINPVHVHDAIWFYTGKAKVFALDRGMNRINSLVHPQHPLLFILSQTWLYMFGVGDNLIRLYFILFYISMIVNFYYVMRRFFDWNSSIFFTCLLSTIPWVYKVSITGHADNALCYYYSIGTLYLFSWLVKKNRTDLILASFFTGFCIWTKPDGLPLACINVALLLLFRVINKKISGIFIYAGLVFVIFLPWQIFRFVNGMVFHYDISQANVFSLLLWFEKLGERGIAILSEFGKEIIKVRHWLFLWPAFIVTCIIYFKEMIRKEYVFIFSVIILNFIFYFLVYVIAPMPVEWLGDVHLPRALLRFVPLLIFVIASGVRKDFQKSICAT